MTNLNVTSSRRAFVVAGTGDIFAPNGPRERAQGIARAVAHSEADLLRPAWVAVVVTPLVTPLSLRMSRRRSPLARLECRERRSLARDRPMKAATPKRERAGVRSLRLQPACVTLRRVLLELSVMEQRYRAVLQVRAGMPVIEAAEAFWVSRQAVHRWLRWHRVYSGSFGARDACGSRLRHLLPCAL